MFACSGSSINDKIAFQRRPTTYSSSQIHWITHALGFTQTFFNAVFCPKSYLTPAFEFFPTHMYVSKCPCNKPACLSFCSA